MNTKVNISFKLSKVDWIANPVREIDLYGEFSKY